MKKKMMMFSLVILTLVTTPGCYFTSAQLIDWVSGTNGLAGLAIDAFWDRNVTPVLNPTGNAVTQTFVDLGEKVAIQLTSNRINQEIPLDPGSVK